MMNSDEQEATPKDPESAIVERLVEALRDVREWSSGLARGETWAEIESALRTLGAGESIGEVLVPIRESTGDDRWSDWLWMLRFARLNDEWGLWYGAGPALCADEYSEHPWRWRPIAECTVQERKEVALALPRLLEAMAQRAEDADVSEALATLRQTLTNLRRVLQDRRDDTSAPPSAAP